MNEYRLDELSDNLKRLSIIKNPIEKEIISKYIENTIGIFLYQQFYREINDKITRDNIVKFLTDLFNIIKIKEIKKVIIACNELNNTFNVIDNNDLVVDIAIDYGELLYNFKIQISNIDIENNIIDSIYFNKSKEQILNI